MVPEALTSTVSGPRRERIRTRQYSWKNSSTRTVPYCILTTVLVYSYEYYSCRYTWLTLRAAGNMNPWSTVLVRVLYDYIFRVPVRVRVPSTVRVRVLYTSQLQYLLVRVPSTAEGIIILQLQYEYCTRTNTMLPRFGSRAETY